PQIDFAAAPAPLESSSLALREESQSRAAGGPAAPLATAVPQSASAPEAYALSPGGAPKPTEPESLRLNAPADTAGLGAQPSRPALARSFATADAAKAAESEKKAADKERSTSTTPPSLYFNANLTTDENGDVTISFKMPAVASEYRLLIDA